MSSEKINSTNGWKAKLEMPDAFTDKVIPDKNRLWDTLYIQLHGKAPVKRTLPWLQLAASIIIMLAAGIFFYHKKGNPKFQPVLSQAPIQRSKLPVVNPVQSITLNSLPINYKNDHTLNNSDKKNIITHQRSGKKVRIENILAMPKENSVSVTSFFHADTITELLSVILPVKKKLKVVSINEMDDNFTERAETITSNKNQFFQLKINRGNSPSSSIVSHPSGGDYIKIKLSTQN